MIGNALARTVIVLSQTTTSALVTMDTLEKDARLQANVCLIVNLVFATDPVCATVIMDMLEIFANI